MTSDWWRASTQIDDLRPAFSRGPGRAFRLHSPGVGVEIRFPWWDHKADAREFLDWLKTAPDGGQWSDLDQAWQIDAVRSGDHFHFLDRNFDTGEVFANLSVTRDQLLRALAEAEASDD